jgi:hypothetical protein
VSAVHWTHWPLVASQIGIPVGHWESVVQPALQRNVVGLQSGAAVPQSEFERHSTHVPLEVRQRG